MNAPKTRLLNISLRLRWVRKDDYEATVAVEVTDKCYKNVAIRKGLPGGMVGVPEMEYITAELSHVGEECAPVVATLVQQIGGLHSKGKPFGVTVVVLVNGTVVGTDSRKFPRLQSLISLPLELDCKSAKPSELPPLEKGRMAGCREYDLVKIKSWPETKIEKERQCFGPPWARVCTDIPVLYVRTCELQIGARICHPLLDEVLHDIEECLRNAVIAGVIATLVTLDPAAGSAALEAFLKACLEAKAGKRASEIRVEVHPQSTRCGEWKRKT